MATSPAEEEASEEYANGWRLLQDHLRSGQSWSGMERHCVFLNIGDANFADASAVSGLDFFDDGRGMAVVDWDHDGDLDLWFSNRTGPRARLLRNDSNSKNSSVSFRLRSESQNPDAIGAEVELFFEGADEERHVRTLRAGSGFISQSSKWVHFGVPEGRTVSHAVVRWPAGPVTEHRGLDGGGRWILRDTNAEPLPWELRRGELALSEGGISAAPSKTSARIPIIQPLPLLGLTTEAPDGRRVPLLKEGDEGLLLTLWADWCVNCKVELAELQAEGAALRDAGLRVLALNVDEPDQRAAGDAFLDSIQWEHERAYAHEDLLEILAVVQRVLMDQPKADAIPTSYLIDGAGRLQVIYRGPVTPAQALKDAKDFSLTPQERRATYAEYEGWWSSENIPTRYSLLAIQLRNRGYPELSAEYMKRITLRGDVDDAPVYAVKRIIGTEINTGLELMEGGDNLKAIESFQRALVLNPKHPVANRFAGVCLQSLGRTREAHSHLMAAVEEDPENAELRNDFGLTLIELGKMNDAADAFKRAIEIDPELAKPRFNLGVYYAREGEFTEAAGHMERALELQPDYVKALTTLGRVYSLQQRHADAEGVLERAIKLNAGTPDVLELYGQALIQTGKVAEARALLPRLRQLDPARAAALEQALGS